MWTRTSIALNGALAMGLVLVHRRLLSVEAEVERIRAQSAPEVHVADGHEPAAQMAAVDPAQLAAEWEQAILPTDS